MGVAAVLPARPISTPTPIASSSTPMLAITLSVLLRNTCASGKRRWHGRQPGAVGAAGAMGAAALAAGAQQELADRHEPVHRTQQ